ncbi:hypothetical protein A3H10_02110 [Candidatus Uhrbacteria bacterium RIFCSPLOWO2_12_FULL_46_10]|uniref:Cohesin domain-containing protein n=1 Tax=Candidatus Uhrbacteria bacterium RIFCSPLOWO2_01_FULL_47_25 TaxID=1802402 RepID=A0A1F7UZ46_9BACT|nr:MAG: hypothetical protein UX68_C0032G0007 [Parcubacteria group bacterium GW2011_GWA2_46_9]OGL60679.1 MAG: hypothetical protein A2752_04265 [Candidatus Uhrbacteria bacterium RIFCSPHIGHO2_01_FULL_46_23]OGL70310.1 MAG: hypothetical protein A3D60_01780 [Candidatus Uhrbacteria bacterium RIFCSPHIGHO2_02_FULL_47_29]OGL75096.1 MAG: hypothetical protein A3E96_01810 [Candidatus Uhrbacteria bacterium RIFCSPHIGHO2_12_FULL_46_13]OGL82997.1 MAG: hypothetical protein A2936_03525 [Candidatus Uhrbacteria bac
MKSEIKSFRDLIVWQKAAALVLIAIFYILYSIFPISPANAGSASLSLVSSKRTYTVGENVAVSVILSTGDVSINAASATITFDQKKLSVVSVSRSGSVFTLWAEEPTFSNSQGVISLGGGLPTPGFSGRGAIIIRITFRAKEEGTTAVRFAGGTVLANDGLGTNVLAGLTGLDLTIQGRAVVTTPPEKPLERAPVVTPPGQVPLAPVILSRTHPDESGWYRNAQPGIIWELPSDAKGVSVSIDQNANGDPGTTSEGLFNFYSAKEPLKDGVWYAHVRVSNSRGWGAIGHYRLAIDTAPPMITTAKLVFEAARTKAIEFATSDPLSSTDYVSILVNGEQVASQASSPYTLPSLIPGNHVITVIAYDKAGNKASQDLYLSILSQEISSAPRTSLLIIIILILALILLVIFIIWHFYERHHRRAILEELAKTRRELKGMSQKLRSLEGKLNAHANANVSEKSQTTIKKI